MFVDLISVLLKVRSFLEHEEAATDVLTEAYTLVPLGSKCSLSGYIKLIKPVIHFPLEGIYQFSVLVTSSPF